MTHYSITENRESRNNFDSDVLITYGVPSDGKFDITATKTSRLAKIFSNALFVDEELGVDKVLLKCYYYC